MRWRDVINIMCKRVTENPDRKMLQLNFFVWAPCATPGEMPHCAAARAAHT